MGDKKFIRNSRKNRVLTLYPAEPRRRRSGDEGRLFHRVRRPPALPGSRGSRGQGDDPERRRGRDSSRTSLLRDTRVFVRRFQKRRRLAEKNLDVFRGAAVDCIVTDCSSCAAALKHETKELLGVAPFVVPVYDLTEFLANHITLSKEMGEVRAKVTYHDPCPLKRGQGISREPRILSA